VLAPSCGDGGEPEPAAKPAPLSLLERIKAAGELRIATRNAPTMYYIDRHDEAAGPEVELAREFAAFLGVDARFDVHDTVTEVLEAVETGRADLAAAGLNPTITRAGWFLFGPEYQQVTPQVVCRKGGANPGSLTELAAEGVLLEVIATSSYAENLDLRQSGVPGLEWTEVDGVGTEQLLERVWAGDVDCTVADSNIVAINRRYHPDLVVAFDLDDPEPLVWVLSADADDLQQAAGRWFESFREAGEMDDWYEHFYAPFEVFDFVDIRAFHRRLEQRFPKYRDMFVDSSELHGVPWTVLSAQSYQESHWDPRAKSPTGVRGIMMLTQPTAKSLGVTDRLDAEKNIEAGARYLAQLEGRLDDEIQEPDRLYFALAAYNVGMGHVTDAQTLARRLGKDPHNWVDLKEVLPLLKKREYYKTVKYGYARGTEPVRYVERIRNYTDILEQQLDVR